MKSVFVALTIVAVSTAMLALPRTAYSFYNPNQGRWLSRDPIQERGGVNVYACLKNSAISEFDRLGLAGCYCCECAEEIWLDKIVPYELSPFNQNPASYFEVKILLSHRTVSLPFPPKEPAFQWWEKSNRPTPGWAGKGQKPDEWANLYQLDPYETPSNWTKRDKNCTNPSTTVITGDEPSADPSQGYRYIAFRITVVNSPECKCPQPSITVTALQTFNPTSTPPMTFTTPLPLQ
jgi:hypothetical protein